VPPYAAALAEALWPGPLTLVLARSERAPDAVTGGRSTVALRVPAHPTTLEVLRALDAADPDGAPHGLAAPSANRHGRVSPTTAAHVADDLGPHLRAGDLILDGGECTVGIESTIIDCTGAVPSILRPGSIGWSEIARITGIAPAADARQVDAGQPAARVDAGTRSAAGEVWPGGLASHYAPRAVVHVVSQAEVTDMAAAARAQGARVGLLAPASVATPPDAARLAAPDDTAGYATCVYAALRSADSADITVVIAVPPDDDSPLAAAVRDRLMRAAAPRRAP
jgi:L-threonylcarbamoyladenylate synthase